MRIRRDLSVIGHSADEVELRYGVWNPISHTLVDEEGNGKLFVLLSDLHQGVEAQEIAKERSVSRSEVEALIDRLLDMGVMETEPSSAIDYHLDKISPLSGTEQNETRSVIVLGDGALPDAVRRLVAETLGNDLVQSVSPSDPLWKQLIDRDHAWLTDAVAFADRVAAFEGWRDSLVVLPQESIDPFAAKAMNRISRELALPWLSGSIDGPFLFIGPTTVPGQGACHECFERRVTMNLLESSSYQRYKAAMVEANLSFGKMDISPSILSLCAAHIAFEATNFALTGRSFTMSKALGIYLPTMELSFNEVLKLAGCPGCDSGGLKDEKELYFELQALLQDESTSWGTE